MGLLWTTCQNALGIGMVFCVYRSIQCFLFAQCSLVVSHPFGSCTCLQMVCLLIINIPQASALAPAIFIRFVFLLDCASQSDSTSLVGHMPLIVCPRRSEERFAQLKRFCADWATLRKVCTILIVFVSIVWEACVDDLLWCWFSVAFTHT